METVSRSNRIQIAIFGKRNAGKSSLVNAITNQEMSLVSDIAGTTTDPVSKSIEILPLGPVVIHDTAGLDDTGELGELRIKKTYEILSRVDIAVIVYDVSIGFTEFDKEILSSINEKGIPHVLVANKVDSSFDKKYVVDDSIEVSAVTGEGIEKLKNYLGEISPRSILETKKLVGDLISSKDVVILVTPIDSAAPKGRVILPQQQVLRDVLDHDGICLVCKETELVETLDSLKHKPALVITDSQAFEYVKSVVPNDVRLTSFSILFARFKGDLEYLVDGAKAIDSLADGSRILVAEACTHHRQADDIGTVKIPKWLKERTGKNLEFDHVSGHGFTQDIENYDLIIHCGSCMINAKELNSRIDYAKEHKVKMVNYGVLIAYINGILDRTLIF